MMSTFNREPRKCPQCHGSGTAQIVQSEGNILNGNSVVPNPFMGLCSRCRGAGVLSSVLDTYSVAELADIVKYKTADDIIKDILSGRLSKKK